MHTDGILTLNGFLEGKIASLGGINPLLHYHDSGLSGIELSKAHPGGIPQFVTGKTVLLSHLVRDEIALKEARQAASNLVAKGNNLLSFRGIHSIHLAIGLTKWTFKSVGYCAPVLLQPVAMRVYRNDFQMKLMGYPVFNAELSVALLEQYGISLDPESFVTLATESGNFKPQPVIEHLRLMTSSIDDFKVFPRLVVSCFFHPARSMLIDFQKVTDNPFVSALIGRREELDLIRTDKSLKLPDASNQLLLEADDEQKLVVSAILEGRSLAIRTTPGAQVTQAVVNVIGGMLANNKRVLVVSARQAHFNDIRNHLRRLGLAGLGVSISRIRHDLIDSIRRNEGARPLHMLEVNDALVRLRRVLLDYRRALHGKDDAIGVSPLDAIEKLAYLSLLEHPPSSAVRFDKGSLEKLSRRKGEAADLLRKTAELGEFECGPGDSLWYGISFATNEDALAAHNLAKHLFAIGLPILFDKSDALISQTNMRSFKTLDELRAILECFQDSRDILEIFRPEIFGLSLEELIEATSPRRRSPGLSSGKRRQLKKLVREYLLPGVRVQGLHDNLVKIRQLRLLWDRYSPAGTTPKIPVGVADVKVMFEKVKSDIASLNKLFANLHLMNMPRIELMKIFESLAADSESIKHIKQRTDIRDQLREIGIGDLLEDLSIRHVPPSRVSDELDLAWWQSVLEFFLKNRSALLGGNTSVIERLEQDFKLVYRASMAAAGTLLAWNMAESWKVALVDYPDEAIELKDLLLKGHLVPEKLFGKAPNLAKVLSPVWFASPYSVHQLSCDFDTVIVLGAGELSIAESLGIVSRGKQIVAFGDPITEFPEHFDIASFGANEEIYPRKTSYFTSRDTQEESLFSKLSEILPSLEMNNSHRPYGLIGIANSGFYKNKITGLPWAGNFLGQQSVTFHYVPDGTGLPDRVTSLVEAVDAEVNFVTSLVAKHIADESCMVVTPSLKMATRIRQELKKYDDQLLAKKSSEPFIVVDPRQALSYTRDRVIFTLGYGLTPIGGVMSGFGPLDGDDGEKLIAIALTRARRCLDIVGCFQPEKIDTKRLKKGPALLMKLLSSYNPLNTDSSFETAGSMLDDLARRLELVGIKVRVNYCAVLPLAAGYANRAVAVDIDNTFDDLHDALSLRPRTLEELGWIYMKVHSFELFTSPDEVAGRIKHALGV
ncbi:DEAD/DEAH box helicase [Tropheryma whipplei]|uniref:DEAD/DEAH box helicase n=1 Tax=Tropheryma whipplei TaxID=2039 RepID=UPI0004AF207A|nr:ATP-binding protein [Tropheryma whipplei]